VTSPGESAYGAPIRGNEARPFGRHAVQAERARRFTPSRTLALGLVRGARAFAANSPGGDAQVYRRGAGGDAMVRARDVDLSGLPKLAGGDLRLLWVNDWYDGPLEAVVERGGERLLMVLHGEVATHRPDPPRWVLFSLSATAWQEEERWHALFEEHVGHHWCFHHEEEPAPSSAREPSTFYDAYAKRPPRALDAADAVAWTDEMPAL